MVLLFALINKACLNACVSVSIARRYTYKTLEKSVCVVCLKHSKRYIGFSNQQILVVPKILTKFPNVIF